MTTTIAVLDKRGENTAQIITESLSSSIEKYQIGFAIATPNMFAIEEQIRPLQKLNIKSPLSMGSVLSKLPRENLYAKLEKNTIAFKGKLFSTEIEENGDKNLFLRKNQDKGIIKPNIPWLRRTDGSFSFIILEPKRIVSGRDHLGIEPLYFGENENLAALASNRKALWKIEIEEARSFPPGHLGFVDKSGFKFELFATFPFSKPKPITMDIATKKLKKLLERSIQGRLLDLEDAAVAFSGGLDSSLIAFLAKKSRTNINLIHVSLENRQETEEAKKAADELKLPITVHLFREADIEKIIPKIVEIMEYPDPVGTSIGISTYWTAEKSAETGNQILLSGQGADELFGGYKRYVHQYLSYGEEKTRRALHEDIIGLHKSNIERDVKICNFHGVELRLPFASCQIAKFALDLPLEFKIERKPDTPRKLILRKLARDLGLPATIANKPKKAMQYATGVNDALLKLAKKQTMNRTEYVEKIFHTIMNRIRSGDFFSNI